MKVIIERDVERWFDCLTEQEARHLVHMVRGSIYYGTVVSYRRLPEEAKIYVRTAFEKAQEQSERNQIILATWQSISAAAGWDRPYPYTPLLAAVEARLEKKPVETILALDEEVRKLFQLDERQEES